MKKVTKYILHPQRSYREFKTFMTAKDKCFIPNCKARCCADAPLPEDFAPQYKQMQQRPVYGAANIGHNDPRDNYNSVIYNTRPVPLILVGHAGRGEHVYIKDKKLAKELGIKTMEEAKELLLEMQAKEIYNYCPFLTEQGRCRVYGMRPPICREFGSSPLPINYCPHKSSNLDIVKFYFKKAFNLKDMYYLYRDLITSKFSKQVTQG